MSLWLVRHGAADGDDGADPGLSATGRGQSAALARRLADHPVAAIRHSPRRRAAETAALLADALPAVPVAASALLDDRTPVPSPARRDDYPRRLWPWLDAVPADERDVDGAALSEAVEGLRAEVLGAGGPIVAVTHAFVIGWFVRAALNAPVTAWTAVTTANAGLTVVTFTADSTRVECVNDTGHLAGLDPSAR